MVLPAKLGTLGIPLFSHISDVEYKNLKLLTRIFREKIFSHDKRCKPYQEIKKVKTKIATSKLKRIQSILKN